MVMNTPLTGMIPPSANAVGMMATRPNAVPGPTAPPMMGAKPMPVMQQPPVVAPNAVNQGQPMATATSALGQNKLFGGSPGTVNALNTLGAGQPYGVTGGGIY